MNTGKINLKLMPVDHEHLSSMRDFFQSSSSYCSYLHEEPLREELFSLEQLSSCGKALAETQVLSKVPTRDHLLAGLADNEKLLTEVSRLCRFNKKETTG